MTSNGKRPTIKFSPMPAVIAQHLQFLSEPARPTIPLKRGKHAEPARPIIRLKRAEPAEPAKHVLSDDAEPMGVESFHKFYCMRCASGAVTASYSSRPMHCGQEMFRGMEVA